MARNTSGLKRTAGPGRPKGLPNKATREFKKFWGDFYASEEYRASAQRRIRGGKAPQLETYIAQMLFGRPKEQIEHSGQVALPTIIENHYSDEPEGSSGSETT